MRVKLSDIAKYSKGVQINGDDLIADGKYIYLNGGINPSGRWNTANVGENTVTISEGGNSSGYINYITEPFWCGAHCYYLYDGPKNTKYLYYALKSQQERLFAIRSGACMPNIKKTDLGNFEFEYDFDEKRQNDIVDCLDKAQQIIESRQQELQKLDDLIKARFVEMFGTYPANERDWATGTIRDLVKEVRYGSSRKAAEGDSGKYPYLRMNNITYSGELDLSDTKTIDIPDEELDKCTVRRGDLLFNRTNSKELVGKTCVYNRDEQMVLAGFVVRVRLNEKALPEFVSAFMNSSFSKQMLLGMCKAAIGQANINAQELQNIGIYIPPIAMQREFVSFKEQVDKSKVIKKTGLKKSIKRGILHDKL